LILIEREVTCADFALETRRDRISMTARCRGDDLTDPGSWVPSRLPAAPR
jgi:hypothetical protein